MRLIVLSENPNSIAVKIAAAMGIPIYLLPTDLSLVTAIDQPQSACGIWLSELPSPDRYREMYNAFLSQNIRLVNRPDHHAIAHEFRDIYNKLSDLSSDLIPNLAADLATNPTLIHSWTDVRQHTNLRHSQIDQRGEPLGRSFRVYLYRQKILTYAYSWTVDDPLKWLTVEEEEAIFGVALKAAALIKLTFVAIDIGQQICGRWGIVAVQDAQFSLLDHMPMIAFWGELGAKGDKFSC